MKRFVVCFALVCASCASQPARESTAADWERRAQTITITRDDMGIAHVRGKTDVDAVFGMIYAQAEDDFNRVEQNFLLSMGRLAESDGEKEIYRDLRMKLFVDPDDFKAKYDASPASLKALMNGWADGLNYYLQTHPNVIPRVIKHWEPWMALTFSEGSIGGDIERVNLTQLEAFYGKAPKGPQTTARNEEEPAYVEPSGSNGIAIAPALTTNNHALLLINPHTSFFFRSELQMASDEGLNRKARTWGRFGTSGVQRARRVDAHVKRRRQHRRIPGNRRAETRRPLLQVRHRRARDEGQEGHGAIQDSEWNGAERIHRLPDASRSGRPRS
jgi:acyl-homoserine-lactone acylase